MTLCLVAIAVGCTKCPIFAVCPVKTGLGHLNTIDGGSQDTIAGHYHQACSSTLTLKRPST